MYVIAFKSPFKVMGVTQWFNHAALSEDPIRAKTTILVAPKDRPSESFEAVVHGRSEKAGRPLEEYAFIVVEENT